jgi:hypothetical protein
VPDASVAGAEAGGSAGAVREGAIALENLAGVLRSPRVGARSLLKALPALQEGPQALAGALDEVARDAAARLAEGPGAAAVARVLSAARAQVDELAAGLAAVRGSFGARTRLTLEARARRTRQSIDAALDVAEAIARTAHPQRAPVNLAELFELRWPVVDDAADAAAAPGVPERGSRSGAIPLTVRLELDTAGVDVDARVLPVVVELAAHAAARAGEVTLRFAAGPRATLHIEPGAGDDRQRRSMAASPLAADALDLARALAKLAGYELREPGDTASEQAEPVALALVLDPPPS